MSTKVTDDRTRQQRGRRAAADSRRRSRTDAFPATSLFEEDAHPGVSRLFTVSMMADVLRVPRAAVRHWLRGGLLEPSRRSGSIDWFEFSQLVVGRQLARLLNSGLSLREIDRKLAALAPGGAPQVARMAERIVTDGHRLSLLLDDRVIDAGGQLLLGFYTDGLVQSTSASIAASPRSTVPIPMAGPDSAGPDSAGPLSAGPDAPWMARFSREVDALEDALDHALVDPASVTDLLDLAADLEAVGALAEAAEALRAVLQAQGPKADIIFMLAELLYRTGDLTAARERYYAVIEIDADHLEARSSLGCVLAELGEHELALAALDGVLRQQPDYADAHWHMASVLHDTGHEHESRRHLRTFLSLAPESPWASMARERLAASETIET